MTTTFFLLGSVAARASGERRNVLPRARPAASRRKSRRLRESVALCSEKDMCRASGFRLWLLCEHNKKLNFQLALSSRAEFRSLTAEGTQSRDLLCSQQKSRFLD